jgi:DNA-directed RNA polymerase specialized sigma24 family protein
VGHDDASSEEAERTRAIQSLETAPLGIALDDWRTMFREYSSDGENLEQCLREWQDVKRFLNKEITADEYYADAQLKQNIETVFNTMRRAHFSDWKQTLVTALHSCTESTRKSKSGHWTEIATDRDMRMYLDMARLLHSKTINGAMRKKLPMFPQAETKLQETLEKAFDEAFMANNFDPERFNNFLNGVIKRRVIDAYRNQQGCTEESAARRPKFGPLTGDIAADDPKGEGHTDASSLIGKVRHILRVLPVDTQSTFFYYIEKKAAGSEMTADEVAAELGITTTVFKSRIGEARNTLMSESSDIADEVTRYFGKAPLFIARRQRGAEVQKEKDPQDNELIALKRELRELFTPENGTFSGVKFARETGIPEAHISKIMGNTDLDPRGQLYEATCSKLEEQLQRMGRADKIDTLHDVIAKMRMASNHRTPLDAIQQRHEERDLPRR